MSDIRNISGSTGPAADEYVEQLRQRIGTGFSAEKIAGKKRNELGKDDFIKLMSAQLKHQDPMNPMKNEQMAAQLAQFSSLEQMVNVNQNLEKMAASQKPQDNLLAASLIGRKIQTDSSQFALKKGAQPDVKFELPNSAKGVIVSIVDSKGEVVREMAVGGMGRGPQSLRWDGKTAKGLEAPVGDYSYRVMAQSEDGASMPVSLSSSGVVSGVVFEGGKAMLLVGERKLPLEAVSRIEAESVSGAGASAQGMAGAGPKSGPSAPAAVGPTGANETTTKNITQQAKKILPSGESSEKLEQGTSVASRKPAQEEGLPDPFGAFPMWNPGNQ
jgi:flagellar hook assembly protein FlgD